MYSKIKVTYFLVKSAKVRKHRAELAEMLYYFFSGLLLKHMVSHSLSELKTPQVKDISFVNNEVVVFLVFHSVQHSYV